MSTSQSTVTDLLNKLDLNKKKGAGKKDWAAINEARKKAFWKPKEGKNQFLILTPAFATDPFTVWGIHKGLQEVEYYSIPCDLQNKDEKCVVCEVVKSLKEENGGANWEANRYLWKPIEPNQETYVPIIDLTNASTIEEGPRWFRIPKTVLSSMIENLKNLEEGEVPFYSHENPQRIILTYNKNEAPATMYSVQFKDIKDVPTLEQYEKWSTAIEPISTYMISKTQEEAKKLVDEYFVRVTEQLEASEEGQPVSETVAETLPAESKLARLKK